ncbi:hypothetical protein EST38_g3993 [Candolleomyces aberdarensis]|uniref:Uncharacterized protein n=1 Tax=Candolleomyces aberdarensis TaxID=2316362 RepID=A0A4Q2DS46_9AGAR|nr:hypothetical protein EST38_g3993 [Candolleomyces aberdarensis]
MRQLDQHLTTMKAQKPKLRVFFVNKAASGDPNASFSGTLPLVNTESAIPFNDIIQRLEVCPDFTPNFQPETPWFWSIGNALRKHWTASDSTPPDANGWTISSIEGFCRYSLMDGMRDRRVRVWFKHDLVDHTSTYMLHNCSEKIKEAIQDRIKLLASSTGRPGDLMFIDYIIVNEVAGSWLGKIVGVYKKLLHYVRTLWPFYAAESLIG